MQVHVTAPMLAAYNHFVLAGFTENGAAAPVGNGCQESGEFLVATMFRAHPDWSGGAPEALKSGGFEEWLGGRKTALIAFIGRAEAKLGVPKGSLLNDLGTQCDFVVYELRSTPSFTTLYEQLTAGSRSIANLTANFCWTYERPAKATANLDNRIAHAEAVAERAKVIKAGPAPQPVPPATVPSVPVPEAPPPALPAPLPAPTPPSASTAGRLAAILDDLETTRAHYLEDLAARDAERARVAAELAIIETAIAEFEKLTTISPALALPSPEAADPAAIIERTRTMLGSNWQTSLSGIGAILGAAAGIAHSLSVGQMPDATQMGVLFAAVAAGYGLIQAKDKNVTGGTIPATAEAKRRVIAQ
ncbi:MAG: phage tail tip lysozyme [Methylocella sp.]